MLIRRSEAYVPGRPTTSLTHWLDVWRRSRSGITEHRRKADETRIEKYIAPAFRNRSVKTITEAEIADWVESLRARGVGAATIYAALMILRQALQGAVDAGAIAVNPVATTRVRGVNTVRV